MNVLSSRGSHSFGLHKIRGSLLGFSTVCMEGENFSRCTACSPSVLDGYSNDPWGFVQKAILVRKQKVFCFTQLWINVPVYTPTCRMHSICWSKRYFLGKQDSTILSAM